jgi:CheY-like chemotaxis protein
MKNKLKCILLIDDDEPTNFLNKLILDEMNCAEHIEIVKSGRDAINFLTASHPDKHNKDLLMPDLVFLDINMPAMDGWEFLDLFNVFNTTRKKKAVTIMLTTSLNPEDETMSKTIAQINGYKRKPLSREMVEEILDQYFPA